jgi:hypothetical protein
VKFICQILGPIDTIPAGPAVPVEARGYESAARVHVACDAPRIALLYQEVLVAVRRADGSGRASKLILVNIKFTAKPWVPNV